MDNGAHGKATAQGFTCHLWMKGSDRRLLIDMVLLMGGLPGHTWRIYKRLILLGEGVSRVLAFALQHWSWHTSPVYDTIVGYRMLLPLDSLAIEEHYISDHLINTL